MKTVTVYIDILFLVNFVTDYFLLLATASFRRLKFSRLRLLLAAATGGFYSCFAFFAPLKLIYSIAGKLAASLIIILIAYKLKSAGSFAVNTICFYLASVCLAGIVMGAELLFSPKNMLLSNGEVYINISAAALILIAAVAYVSMLVFSRFFKPRGREELKEITLTVENRSRTLTALYDSGNLLTDALSGASVIIVSLPALKGLIPTELLPVFYQKDLLLAQGTAWQKRLCIIPYSSMSGKSLLVAFRPDSLKINGVETEQKTVIAVKNGNFSDKYDAIVGTIN